MHPRAVHRPVAAPPRPPALAVGTGGPAGSGGQVDDAVAAVERELRSFFDEVLGRCRALDPGFAADVAARLARFTLGGGRRTRSRFLWWTARACGGDGVPARALSRVGAALELIQTCALVHDDVLDGSASRRGGPSFHTQVRHQYAYVPDPGAFGTASAVLAGDLALAWADDLVAAADLPPGTRGAVLRIWRSMRTEMVAGQYLDLHGQATGSRSAVLALRTACLKTARYTVEAPMALGAALAGAPEATGAALGAAGRCAGIAFQLRDDLLGVFGDPAVTGKPSGDDIRSGKSTYLLAVARARAAGRRDAYALDVLDRRVGDRSLTEEGLAEVRRVLGRTGAPEVVERRLGRLTAAAEGHLAGAALREPAAGELARLLREAAFPQPGPGPEAGTGPGRGPGPSPQQATAPRPMPPPGPAAGSGGPVPRAGEPAARSGGPATGPGGPATGPGGPAMGSGGPATGPGSPATGSSGPAAGAGGPAAGSGVPGAGEPAARSGGPAAGSGGPAAGAGDPAAGSGGPAAGPAGGGGPVGGGGVR